MGIPLKKGLCKSSNIHKQQLPGQVHLYLKQTPYPFAPCSWMAIVAYCGLLDCFVCASSKVYSQLNASLQLLIQRPKHHLPAVFFQVFNDG